MNTRKLTFSAILISIGVLLGNIVYIPIGISKCYPIQHTINFISAITLGPVMGTVIAFLISLIRNILGTGSLLAFPGSMVGALLAGILYRYSDNKYLAAIGEVVGTGLFGGLLAFPIAKIFMGQDIVAFFFVYPFLISTIGGSILGLILDKAIDFRKIFASELNSSFN